MACAEAFYLARKAAMDKGAEVLDPHAQPLFKLFTILWAEGRVAFYRELLHIIRVPGDRLFDSNTFARCTVETDKVTGELTVVTSKGARILLSDMVSRIARWDHAKGVPGGDYAALAVLLRDRWGFAYVVDCFHARAPTSKQIEAAWRLAEKWGLSSISLESDGGQYLVDEIWVPQMEKRRLAKQFYQCTLTLSPARGNKEDRLATMEPVTSSSLIEFGAHLPPLAFQSYDDFDGEPNSHHDDGPDAIQGAYARSGGMPPMMSDTRIR
tara:strand:- start:59 stop:862 length:804 start_codon:yes stop_codon:yes gene_type:complete